MHCSLFRREISFVYLTHLQSCKHYENLLVKYLFFFCVSSNHCLAAPDLGAGVEQPYDWLIVQNRQAVQSMGKSMDWTLEDNMVDGLFFCATLTSRRGSHTSFVQTWTETPDSGVEAVKPNPGSSWEGRSGRMGAGVGDENAETCGVVCPLRISLVITHSAARVLLLSDELMRCCAAGTNGCLDLRQRASALDGRVSAECECWCPSSWHGVLETVWLHCGEAQQVECLLIVQGCLLVQDASIQSQFARCCWWRCRWGGCEHCGNRQERSTLRLNVPRLRWLFAGSLLQHPTGPASRLRSAKRDISFLWSDARCQRYLGDLSNVTLRYLNSEQRAGFVVDVDF